MYLNKIYLLEYDEKRYIEENLQTRDKKGKENSVPT